MKSKDLIKIYEGILKKYKIEKFKIYFMLDDLRFDNYYNVNYNYSNNYNYIYFQDEDRPNYFFKNNNHYTIEDDIDSLKSTNINEYRNWNLYYLIFDNDKRFYYNFIVKFKIDFEKQEICLKFILKDLKY